MSNCVKTDPNGFKRVKADENRSHMCRPVSIHVWVGKLYLKHWGTGIKDFFWDGELSFCDGGGGGGCGYGCGGGGSGGDGGRISVVA